VYGENISRAAQFVQSEMPKAGILAYSLATSAGLRAANVGDSARFYPSIQQTVVVLKAAANRACCTQFVNLRDQGTGAGVVAAARFSAAPIR
jgi:hypothetical protein